jgi:uncharacterized protein
MVDFLRKTEKLKSILIEIRKAVVALSGGVDSSCLASIAKETLGDNVSCITVLSPLLPTYERNEAQKLAEYLKIPHEFIVIDELSDKNFSNNPIDKCYICKLMRLEKISSWAKERGIPWILDGSNIDDLNDFRPGMKALKEFSNVRSPFLEAGINKKEIRDISRQSGLSVWNKPAAACLASRISLSQPITKINLKQVEEAEEFLYSMLPREAQLRVRHHVQIARIEVDRKFIDKIIANSGEIESYFKTIGFKHTTLDLSGYNMGSLND